MNEYGVLLSNSQLSWVRSDDDISFNSRVKYYRNSSGDLVPYEAMFCNRLAFRQSGFIDTEQQKEIDYRLDYQKANAELFGNSFGDGQRYKSAPLSKEELLDCSRRRAKRKIFDYCICNEFSLFITLTLDKSLIDRSDYSAVIKKLNSFLSNRVNRYGLKYIGVPEYHKNGGLHFHFATNGKGFKLENSGTVSVEGRKKPIKVSTADRLRIPLEDRHTVYNITDWKLGFSTAIYTYGERGALAQYLAKELNKDCQKKMVKNGNIDKIGGRWYLHGGKLCKPIVKLGNVNFSDVVDTTYEIDTQGGKFKVLKLTEKGELLRYGSDKA